MSAWGAQKPSAAAIVTGAASAASVIPSKPSADEPNAPPLVMTLAPPESPESIDLFEGVERVTEVEIEGVALLQIVKHCHESQTGSVAGSLLGLDSGAVLEVTNSFPSPPSSERKKESDEYQLEMMKNLREVGMDNNKVGWYQSVSMGTFCTSAVVEYQFQYQRSLGPNAVCLVYDAAETAKGALSLRAFRLKQQFYDAYKAGNFTKESFAKSDIRSTTLLEELPIRIHNSDIISAWLHQAVLSHEAVTATSFDRLDLASNAYLESSLKNISLWADELAQEHYKFQGYERALSKQRQAYAQWQARQRDENKLLRENGEELLPEEDADFFKSVHQPSRLEALLITKQMNTYCEHINRYAGKSFQKLFLAAKFHQEE